MTDDPDTQAVASFLEDLHRRIVASLQTLDRERFVNDTWKKDADQPLGGHGVTSILEPGSLFERAGVGFSRVTGQRLPPSASVARPELAGRSFEAIGVSLVLHPRNPYVPTVHMNVRFFVASGAGQAPVWWFGGGMDLTPYYGFEEDARHFHGNCKLALDPYGAELYPKFKAQCDAYFRIKHRNEPRGIGGIFFDDFHALGFSESFAMLQSVGNQFLAAYIPIVERRRAMTYGDDQRAWQALRRGRYVEFNLVYDRGTLFGLQSGGRTESILMSMPPVAAWRYDHGPTTGSPESVLLTDFLIVRDWV
jgi:coproporphyrinogen III oxidase